MARSKRGRQHFKHFRNSGAGGCAFCDPGTSAHKAAIRLLSVRLSEVMVGQIPMPLLSLATPSGPRLVLLFVRSGHVVTEWSCPGSGCRADLALVDGDGSPILLIEVYYSHAVNIEKRQDLNGYWWIEVDAQRVLDDIDTLVIRSHGGLPRSLAEIWEQASLF